VFKIEHALTRDQRYQVCTLKKKGGKQADITIDIGARQGRGTAK